MRPAAKRRYQLTVYKKVGDSIYGGKTTVGTLDYLVDRLIEQFGVRTRVKVVGMGHYSIGDRDAELVALEQPRASARLCTVARAGGSR